MGAVPRSVRLHHYKSGYRLRSMDPESRERRNDIFHAVAVIPNKGPVALCGRHIRSFQVVGVDHQIDCRPCLDILEKMNVPTRPDQ